MSTTKDKGEPSRLELCNWSEEVPVAVQSKGNHYSAKPKARGIKTEADIAGKIGIDPATVTTILDAALSFIRDGYDVELCKAIHIYGCVKSLKTPFIAAKWASPPASASRPCPRRPCGTPPSSLPR